MNRLAVLIANGRKFSFRWSLNGKSIRYAVSVALSVGLLLVTLGLTPQTSDRGAKYNVFGYDVAPDFVRFDPEYRKRIAAYKERYEKLSQQLYSRQMAGRKSVAAHQVLVEDHWLIYYTADYPRIERGLERLEKVLAALSDPAREKEQAADGSYGAFHDAWFYKLDRTCDRLVIMEWLEEKPPSRLAFLDRVNSSEKLRAYLDPLLVSDVAKTGVDNRFELNLAATDLLRLINGKLPSGYKWDPKVRPTMEHWIKDVWQDPTTGFFGAWFKTPNGLRKTADISCTFHVAHYTDGKIGHWREIVQTLFKMRDLEFPYGWLQEGKMSNHHNLDVATLFKYGWPVMSADEKKRAKAEFRRMLDHVLNETLNADGSFKQEDMSSVGEAFMFPVELLAELGYFNRSERFWTDEEFPKAHDLAKRIARKIRDLKLDDAQSQTGLAILETAD